jgi:hypothetical protein
MIHRSFQFDNLPQHYILPYSVSKTGHLISPVSICKLSQLQKLQGFEKIKNYRRQKDCQ